MSDGDVSGNGDDTDAAEGDHRPDEVAQRRNAQRRHPIHNRFGKKTVEKTVSHKTDEEEQLDNG